jgi:diguanylate cyclase (GGDEF)-like protein
MVLGGSQTGRVLPLSAGPSVTIGRSPFATHRLDEPSVSSTHVRIVRSGDRYILADQQATNGTYLNGTRVTDPLPLSDGDRVQLGPLIVLRFTLVNEAEEASLKMVYESAHRDGLTGVFNRKHFEERLVAELSHAERYGKELSLILFDLDHFKEVNDKHGHLAGDQVLRTAASIILRGARTEDVVARYGGEEFVQIVRDVASEVALGLAERTRVAVSEATIDIEGRSISVTISGGVASLSCCGQHRDLDTLLRVADKRLYRAKLAGRNRVERERLARVSHSKESRRAATATPPPRCSPPAHRGSRNGSTYGSRRSCGSSRGAWPRSRPV